MKLRVKYDFRFVFKDAMVIYPYMLFKHNRKRVTEQLFRHELEHVYQVQRMGWLRFYVSYLWLLMRHGYDSHPYELEAYAIEHEPLTTAERHWYET